MGFLDYITSKINPKVLEDAKTSNPFMAGVRGGFDIAKKAIDPFSTTKKRFIGGGIGGMFDKEYETPSTYGQAFKQAIPRIQKQFSTSVYDERGKEVLPFQVDPKTKKPLVKGGKLVEDTGFKQAGGYEKMGTFAGILSPGDLGGKVKVYKTVAESKVADDIFKTIKGSELYGAFKNTFKDKADDVLRATSKELEPITKPEEVSAFLNKKLEEGVKATPPTVTAGQVAEQADPKQAALERLQARVGEVAPVADEATPEIPPNQAALDRIKARAEGVTPETSDLGRPSTDVPVGQEKVQISDQSRIAESTAEQTPQLSLKEEKALPESYNIRKEKAIADTATQLNEKPTIVRRVVDAVNKFKTWGIEYFQDTDIRVKQLLSQEGAKVSDASDPYLKSTLYSGRVGSKVEHLNNQAKEIIFDLKKSKIDKKEVSDFLLYRHAPERNASLGEGAAGITTKEAEEGMARLRSSPNFTKIEETANKLQEINNSTLDILRDAGVITEDLYKTLKQKYKNHIPLNRIFEETDDVGQILSGRGYDVKSTGIKKAVGSEREISDIMTNIITNNEQAILRAEKNIVDNATLKFVRENKDILGDAFEVTHPKMIGKTLDGRPILEVTQDPKILQLFENGKRVWIKIKDPNLAIALRGVSREKLPGFFRPIAAFGRLYSGLHTRFNPAFALPNKIRDLQETMVYMAAQKGVGAKGSLKTLTKDPQSLKDIMDALRGIDSPGARTYREMQEMGGTTGGMSLSTRKQTELNLDNLEKLANSKTRNIANNIVEYIDNFNSVVEDSTRLSVYKQALEQGLSKERAAFLAKEASVNFNRMGRGGPIINALYMFSNASIQGSAKMIKSLRNPKVLGAVLTTVGSSVAAVGEWNEKIDPQWRDKVSEWDRLNGLTVMLPPGKDGESRYFTIPVSWGLKPIKLMADYAYDGVSGQEIDWKKMFGQLGGSLLEAYNPVGGTDFMSAVTPTAGDIPLEIARNKSWTGKKIRPDYDKNAPKDIQYFSSLGDTATGRGAISISEFARDKFGISVSPADIKYAFDQYIGGVGRTIKQTAEVGGGLATGKPVPLDEYPIISRFYRQNTAEEVGANAGKGGEVEILKKQAGEQSREKFYLKQEAEVLSKELDGLSNQQKRQRLIELAKSKPDVVKKFLDIQEEKGLSLSSTDKMIKSLNIKNGERAKYINGRLDRLKTNAERRQFLIEMTQKKLLTDDVLDQVLKLRNQ